MKDDYKRHTVIISSLAHAEHQHFQINTRVSGIRSDYGRFWWSGLAGSRDPTYGECIVVGLVD